MSPQTCRRWAIVCAAGAVAFGLLGLWSLVRGEWLAAVAYIAFAAVWCVLACKWLERKREHEADIRAEVFLQRAKFVHGTLDGQTRVLPLTGPAWPEVYEVIYTNERYTYEGEGVYVLDDIARELDA